ncbi:MAG: inorganic phosphate transporter [Thermoplasmata archaeon]
MEYIPLIVASAILAALVSGNNLSVAVGSLVGSNILKKNYSKILAIIGFISGLLLGSHYMRSTTIALFPSNNILLFYVLFGTLVIFIIAQILRVPISLTMALVGIGIGLMFHYDNFNNALIALKIVIFWIIAPLSAILLSLLLGYLYTKISFQNIWNFTSAVKILLLIVSFFSAFTLGENTLGLILNISGFSTLSITLIIIGTALGAYFLSEGVLKRISFEIYSMRYSTSLIAITTSTLLVELATIFSIPLSNTQTMTLGIVGVGLSYKARYIIINPLLKILAFWIISPVIGIIFGIII